MKDIVRYLTIAVTVALSSVVHATVISYELTFLGGNTWQYDYGIENDSLSSDISAFTIFFDVGLYENISINSGLGGWDIVSVEPDISIPDDGFVDGVVLSASSAIRQGGFLNGLSVKFDFIGFNFPDNQFFEIYNPITFFLVDSGVTQETIPTQVSEPNVNILFFVGLLGIWIFRANKKIPKNKTSDCYLAMIPVWLKLSDKRSLLPDFARVDR